jgi:hypothetical protein
MFALCKCENRPEIWPSKSGRIEDKARNITQRKHVRFEVFRMVKINVVVLWAMTPYTLVGGYQCFGGAHCSHLQDIKDCYNDIVVS